MTTTNKLTIDAVVVSKDNKLVCRAHNDNTPKGWVSTYECVPMTPADKKQLAQIIADEGEGIQNFYRNDTGLKAMLFKGGVIKSELSLEQIKKAKDAAKKQERINSLIGGLEG